MNKLWLLFLFVLVIYTACDDIDQQAHRPVLHKNYAVVRSVDWYNRTAVLEEVNYGCQNFISVQRIGEDIK